MPLEVRNISSSILNNISLTIEDASMNVLMGPSGSGKTTLLNILSGLDEAEKGEVLLDGENNKTKIKKNVLTVFQQSEKQLFASTVEEDIAFILRKEKLSKEEKKKRVIEACTLVGLDTELLSKSPLALSGGERRKVALAGILIAKPKFLLLDEPLSGLDAKSRKLLLSSLKFLNKEGSAILIVTHSPDEAILFPHLFVMAKGTLIYDGKTREILSSKERAERMGLEATTAAEVAFLLNERGIKNQNILTDEELATALRSAL